MEFSQRTGKSQPNTRTCGNLPLFLLTETDKRLENLFFHFIRNNHSVILGNDIKSLIFRIYFQLNMHISIGILHPIVQKITYNLRKSFTVDMCTEVFFRQFQRQIKSFLAWKGSKPHISFPQHISNITFGKIETIALALHFPKVQKLVCKIQQTLRIMLHDIQILTCLRIQMFLQDYVLQRAFYQCQRSPDLMRHIREEIYLSIINLAFFLLLELLQLAAMLSVATLLEVPESIYRATDNEQCINAVSPNRKVERRKDMNIQ